jgi:TrpR family trp operon transcriptional repressor
MARHIETIGEQDVQEVAELFAGIADSREMYLFLREIMTTAELHDLALRWRLMQRLHAGVAQRRIAAELKVSLCKITRGSRILKQPKGVVRKMLELRQARAESGAPS